MEGYRGDLALRLSLDVRYDANCVLERTRGDVLRSEVRPVLRMDASPNFSTSAYDSRCKLIGQCQISR